MTQRSVVKLKPVAPPSRVKLCTSEPLHSPDQLLQRKAQALPNAREVEQQSA